MDASDLFICDENGTPLMMGDLTEEQRKLTLPEGPIRLQSDKVGGWVNGCGSYEQACLDAEIE